jgi:nucleosome binding factor SPN SPT16 subunit
MCAGFADLLSVKEESEILNAKKAAFLASKVMQAWVVEKIEDIIDKNKKVKHLKLSGEEGVDILSFWG